MFDWIPLEIYTPLYYYLLFLVVIMLFLDAQANKYPSGNKFQLLGTILLIFILGYIGFRPISGYYFGDTATYAEIFYNYAGGSLINTSQDLVFNGFMKFASSFMSVHFFFFICAMLYTIPLYIICKKWFKELWFLGFIFFITALSFWSYGTNGVRNGIAGSLFLLGISRDKRVFQIAWILLAIGFHKTMLLPTLGFVLANIYNQPKKMIAFWAACIPLSLVGGRLFESFFGSLGFDDRLSYLTTSNVNENNFSSTGFRWDFVLYSATAIYAGWYYIVKKGYQDKVYYWLFNTYVFANAFWILVIRANFSNRFAYLSWFMIGLVIVYPLLRTTLFANQYKKVGFILLLYFSFTFIMAMFLS